MSGVTAATVAAYATIAATVVSAVSSYQNAQTQKKALYDGAVQRNEQIAVEQKQANDRATSEMSERARVAMVEQARIQVLQAESGLSGLSNDRVLGESRFNESFDIARIEGNRGRTQGQITQTGLGYRAEAQSRINSVKSPGLLGAGLQIVGMGADYKANELKNNSGSYPG